MNNQPVAWIDPKELDMDVSTTVTKNKQFDSDIPLYTASQTKRLSDEEIDLIASNCWYEDEDLQMFNHQKFAKLIQERHGIK